jgi:DNA repair exonuclease SbcCD ATPase subunit
MAPAANNERWRLESITIRGFRGVAKERTFRFDGRPALLKGNNGLGKSTVAQALQWTLFGRFPEHVLANVSYDRFLAPVSAKSKSYRGEVVLVRGQQRMEAVRDGKLFTLKVGGKTLQGEDADAKRDSVLGLDMDTFVRAVLLLQSRVRGLLVDEVKERNKALDRLLGMDAIEAILDVVKPKLAADAADSWRSSVEEDQQGMEARHKLLGEQLDEAQDHARTLGFLNKDFNSVGLAKAYADIGERVASMARKYGVKLDTLPACETVAKVDRVSRAFAEALRAIRVNSQKQLQLASIMEAIAKRSALLDGWKEALGARDQARTDRATLVAEHGGRDDLLERRRQLDLRLADERESLKTANLLRQLLADALAYTKSRPIDGCPVCEQPLPTKFDLSANLRRRTEATASAKSRDLEAASMKTEAAIVSLAGVVGHFDEADKTVNASQTALDKLRQRVVEALGGSGIAENKVQARLEESIESLSEQKKTLAGGVREMEEDLEGLDSRERALRDGLVPVLRKREELAAFEAQEKRAQAAHKKDLEQADAMEELAARLERVRQALLEAKEQLAGETLGRARPRAQQLYRTLVKQPLFDTLDIRTVPRAKKVDYAFEVSSSGASASSREARLVLSDGQLTATALALFFALAESTQHSLDVLYVDDPTQNLDLPSKEAMAKVVTEMAQRRQVIVSTQDEDFANFLESEGFPKRAVVHHFTSWNGNPTVETHTPDLND